MYTVDYFIAKFSAIPENKWTVGVQVNELNQRLSQLENGDLNEKGSNEKSSEKDD